MAEEPKEILPPLDERILGVWRQVDARADGVKTFELTRDRFTWAVDNRIDRVYPVIGQIDQAIVYSWWGSRQQQRFELEGEILTIEVWGPSFEVINQRYARLGTRPSFLDPKPLILGDLAQSLAPHRLGKIRKERKCGGGATRQYAKGEDYRRRGRTLTATTQRT